MGCKWTPISTRIGTILTPPSSLIQSPTKSKPSRYTWIRPKGVVLMIALLSPIRLLKTKQIQKTKNKTCKNCDPALGSMCQVLGATRASARGTTLVSKANVAQRRARARSPRPRNTYVCTYHTWIKTKRKHTTRVGATYLVQKLIWQFRGSYKI